MSYPNVSPVDVQAMASFKQYLDQKLAPLIEQSASPIRVLEVGCGSGALAAMIIADYPGKVDYKAIDPSPEAIEKCRARGLTDVNVEQIGFEHVPLMENSYDALVFSRSFHHLPSLSEAVERTYALLKPGGLFILDEFAREAIADETARFIFEKVDSLGLKGKIGFSGDGDHTNYAARRDALFRHGSHTHHPAPSNNEPPQHEPQQPPHEHQHPHEQEHQHHNHPHHQHGHHHPHHHHHHQHVDYDGFSIPTWELIHKEIVKRFPELEITNTSFLYTLLTMSTNLPGGNLLEQVREEEDRLIAEKKIVAIGRRVLAKKF